MEQTKIEPGFINIEQASNYTQIKEKTLKKYISEGKLKAYKPGRHLLFRIEDLDKFIRTFPAVG